MIAYPFNPLVVQVTATNDLGMVVTLDVVENGTMLGELAILANRRRTATLTALEPCRMLFIPNVNIGPLFAVAPELLDDLVNLANERRSNCISILGKNFKEKVPQIDELPENKLHIYSLLRNEFFGQCEEGDAAAGNVISRRTEGKKDEARLYDDAIASQIDEGEAEVTKGVLIAENNTLRHESQFLDIQIFDLLSCIKLLEDGNNAAGVSEEESKEGGGEGGRWGGRNGGDRSRGGKEPPQEALLA